VKLILAAAAGGGREQLVQQLLQRYPQRFVVPRKLTDRKPAKGEKDTPELEFVKPDVLAKLAAQGQVMHSQADAAAGSTTAVTADVLHELAAAGA
jgi:guanylate kinase